MQPVKLILRLTLGLHDPHLELIAHIVKHLALDLRVAIVEFRVEAGTQSL